MKKCPTCDKTFDDNLRFCQTDGTLLVDVVENAPVEDPYKTTVARPDEIASAIPPVNPYQTVVGGMNKNDESDDLLQLPEEHDPLKTMVVSESDLRKEMESSAPKEDVIDLPPIAPPPFTPMAEEKPQAPPTPSFTPPEPPKFNEPNLSPPSFGDAPSPFSDSKSNDAPIGLEDKTMQVSSDNPFSSPPPIETSPYNSFGDEPMNRATGPIPSPFDKGKLVSFDPPATPLPTYKEPEPIVQEPSNPFAPTPFGQASEPVNQQMAQSDWTPPPAPDAGWQNQQIGQNTPFQPPVAGGSGQNQTLAIVSLVLGILSCLCCVSFITGPAGLITGYIAKGKADTEPNNYGGRGLALGGMITGAIGTLIGIAAIILNILGAFAERF
jgi:Domain of unknown function (DUF4190)